MGQRLNIQFFDGESEDPIVNSHFHWSAYTSESALTVSNIIDYLKKDNGETKDLKILAIKALNSDGAGFNEPELAEIEQTMPEYLELAKSMPYKNNSEGLISITKCGMKENKDCEDDFVDINLKTGDIDFSVLFKVSNDSYFEDIYEMTQEEAITKYPDACYDISDYCDGEWLLLTIDNFQKFAARFNELPRVNYLTIGKRVVFTTIE